MKKKEFYKPKSSIYREIINLTQSVLYTPQSEEWFFRKFPKAEADEIREALLYLCHTRYLKKLDDGIYAIDIDFRTRIRGIYHYDGKNGHVHADSIRKIHSVIHIPHEWSKNAIHNDRVEVAVEGELSENGEVILGTVQKIVQTSGDLFVGRLNKINGKWIVFPDEKEVGEYIPVLESPEVKKSGVYVFAALNREQSKDKSCTILKTLRDEEERIAYKYGFYPEISKTAHDEFMIQNVRQGKPVKRCDFTDAPAMLLNEQCAVSVSRAGQNFKIMVHVPDVCDKFVPDSEFEKELLRRCAGKNFLPHRFKENLKFTDGSVRNAFTVVFETDLNGNIINPQIERSRVLTCKEQAPLFDDAARALKEKGFIVNTFMCAANDAAAMWFDKMSAAAPYASVYYKENAQSFMNVAKKLNMCESTEVCINNVYSILEHAGQKGRLGGGCFAFEIADVQMSPFGEDNVTVPFCNPLENYLSVLMQYCLVQQKKLRTTEKKNAHLKFVFERAALYNYRIFEYKKYLRASENIRIDKKLKLNEKYEGVFITNIVDMKKALFFVNGGLGTVKTNGLKLECGEKVLLSYEGISLDRQELFYKKEEI